VPAKKGELEDIFANLDQTKNPVAGINAAGLPPAHKSSVWRGVLVVLMIVILLAIIGMAFWYFAVYRTSGTATKNGVQNSGGVASTSTLLNEDENATGTGRRTNTGQVDYTVIQPPSTAVEVIPSATTSSAVPEVVSTTTPPIVIPPPVINAPNGNIPLPIPVVVPPASSTTPTTSVPVPVVATSTCPNSTLDTDQDGLTDCREVELGTDPLKADTDGDGLSDGDEVLKYGTNPLNPDTDGDSYPDGVEALKGYNPRGPGKCLKSSCEL